MLLSEIQFVTRYHQLCKIGFFQELGMNAEYNSVLIEEDAFETRNQKINGFWSAWL